MTIERKSLRFSHHALATLGAVTLASTVFSIIFLIMIVFEGGGRVPGLSWLTIVILACWVGVFILALPAAGLFFSLLWPVTRRRTPAARMICMIAGVTIGVILAPMASPHHHGASLGQLAVFATTGVFIAIAYLTIGNRLSRDAATRVSRGLATAFE